jgi:tetratricopeptide (TPR) repeat protein
METTGTVTMYYTFVEPRVRDILESIFKESKDLSDFVMNLGSYVCTHLDEPILAHIAAVLAFEIREAEVTESIANAYENEPIVKPWTFPMRSRGDRIAIQNKIEVSVESALQTVQTPWLVMELLLLKAYALIHTPSPELSNALEDAKYLLDQHDDLQCFRPHIYHVEARILWQEGSMEDGLNKCETGIEIARAFENQYELSRLLAWKGIITTSYNAQQAEDLLEEAYNIVRRLGDKFHMSGYMLELAEVATILGEYDLALEYYKSASEIYSPIEGPVQQNAQAISMLYSDMEEYDEALTWARWNYEKHFDVGSEGDVFALCVLAWPMIFKGRLKDAEELIDDARSRVLSSGHEPELGMCHLVTGLHELASGNVDTAFMTLQDALHSFKHLRNQVFTIRSLQALAKAELISSRAPDIYGKTEQSSKWIDELEKYSRENELPGVRMYSAIVKADFHTIHGQKKEAISILKDGLKILDSPGVASLRNKIVTKLGELELTG